jgi:hypothetical protein
VLSQQSVHTRSIGPRHSWPFLVLLQLSRTQTPLGVISAHAPSNHFPLQHPPICIPELVPFVPFVPFVPSTPDMSEPVFLTVFSVHTGDFNARPVVPHLLVVDGAEAARLLPPAMLASIKTIHPPASIHLVKGQVAVSYHPFNGRIAAHPGEDISFVCEANRRLVFRPLHSLYTPDLQSTLEYGLHLKHELYFYRSRLVYAIGLNGGSEQVKVRFLDVQLPVVVSLAKAFPPGTTPDTCPSVAKLSPAVPKLKEVTSPSKAPRAEFPFPTEPIATPSYSTTPPSRLAPLAFPDLAAALPQATPSAQYVPFYLPAATDPIATSSNHVAPPPARQVAIPVLSTVPPTHDCHIAVQPSSTESNEDQFKALQERVRLLEQQLSALLNVFSNLKF